MFQERIKVKSSGSDSTKGAFCMRMVRKSIRLLIFIFIFVFVFNCISCVFSDKDVNLDQHETIPDFYRERSGSLDVVWIGASHVYCYYQAPVGWEQSGIAIYPYASSAQPAAALPFLIEEVKKTQPQALILANLNSIIGNGVGNAGVHWLADWMPFSKTKIDMIRYLYDNGEGADADSLLEYYFPIIRYHPRWNMLSWQDIHYMETGEVKGAKMFASFLSGVKDVSENDRTVTSSSKLTELEFKRLESILNYCDENKVNILFVFVPQYTEDESRDAKYLWAQEYVMARGYSVLNMKESGGVKLDLTQDYVDQLHTNIHGSIKISESVCKYLTENYGFTDKRGDPNYADWDEAWDRYSKIIKPYLTEDEIKQLQIQ